MVAAEAAVASEHAMTGHHERDRVAADRGADRARGGGLTQMAGNVAVADRAAHRNPEQRLPHPHLEVGADHDEAYGAVLAPGCGREDLLGVRGRLVRCFGEAA